MAGENSFRWGQLVEPLEHQLEQIGVDPHLGIDLLITTFSLLVLAFFGGKRYRLMLKAHKKKYYDIQEEADLFRPTSKISFAAVAEIGIINLFQFTSSIIGKNAQNLFFLLGSLFFFVLVNNLVGTVPGFAPPTEEFNTTIVLGCLVFLTTHVIGLKTHGLMYIKHFTGPVWWLTPLMLPIEIIGHLVRPLSLALRLFGNMTGDHKVVAVFFGIFPLLLPLPFMASGIFISVLQAFVFLLLSLIYLSGALEHAH